MNWVAFALQGDGAAGKGFPIHFHLGVEVVHHAAADDGLGVFHHYLAAEDVLDERIAEHEELRRHPLFAVVGL